MKRLFLVTLAIASVCTAREYEPNEVEISLHRKEVYAAARDYVVKTFNLDVIEESAFNPVRFNSNGVWGNFEARIKDLGGDRFEVQGWVHTTGRSDPRIRWTVHIRYPIADPEAWKYLKIGEKVERKSEVIGWKFGEYHSLRYEADYDPNYVARTFR